MARSLNGSSDFMRYSGAVVSSAPLTLSAWVYRNAVSNTGDILGIYESAAALNGNLFVVRQTSTSGGNNSIRASAGQVTLASALITRSITDWPENTWQHVAGVFETTTSRYAYAGGVAGSQNTTSSTPSGMDRTSIGRRDNTAANNHLQGSVADAAVYNVALSASEIAVLASGVSPMLVRPEALVAYWPLIGRYSPEPDLFGGTNLTLTGTSLADHPRIYRSSTPLQLGVPAAAVAASQQHLLLLGVG